MIYLAAQRGTSSKYHRYKGSSTLTFTYGQTWANVVEAGTTVAFNNIHTYYAGTSANYYNQTATINFRKYESSSNYVGANVVSSDVHGTTDFNSAVGLTAKLKGGNTTDNTQNVTLSSTVLPDYEYYLNALTKY